MIGRIHVLLTTLLLCTSLGAKGLTETEITASSRAYFAPMTCFAAYRMRMPDGVIREFMPSADGRVIDSVDGWTAKVDGIYTLVKTPKGVSPKLEWGFERGTLKMLAVDGTPYGLDYTEPVFYHGEKIQPLWPKADELKRDDIASGDMWHRTLRLRLWFESPNRAGLFLAFFALAAFFVAWRFDRKVIRVIASVATVALLVLVVKTDSRSAMLAFAAGAAIIGLSEFRRRGVPLKRILIAFAVLSVLAGLSLGLMRFVSPRPVEKADRARANILAEVPRMFATAPGGWGRYAFVGRGYIDWFEQSDVVRARLNLVSDHATRMVGYGWYGGALYVFAWVAGIAFLLLLVWRGASPLPAALWSAFCLGALFNLVYSDWEMWVLPLGSLLLLLPAHPWRAWRQIAASVVLGVLAACAVVGGVLLMAAWQKPSVPTIAREGNRILVAGENPRIWVVDDSQCLGHVMTGKEIRRHYRHYPKAEAIGYVRRLDDLPNTERVTVLVLAGERGLEYIKRFERDELSGTLPCAIVFLSPPFGPERIPEELRRLASVSILIGEFAARYYPDYGRKLPWVKIVAGAEQYIPGWMRYLAQ